MLGNFPPFTTMQELNLDWILTKIKNILRFVPDDGAVGQILRRTPSGAEWSDEQGAGGSVTSVNGMQGAVVLGAADVGALPDTTVIPDSTSDLVNDSGFVNASGAAAAAPVQSVNGQTGTVSLGAADVGALPDTYVAPVTSVNGQTGAVSLTIPDSTSDLVNDSGFVDATGAAAAAPVQSVNGRTGAVTVGTKTTLFSGTISLNQTGALSDTIFDYDILIMQWRVSGTGQLKSCVMIPSTMNIGESNIDSVFATTQYYNCLYYVFESATSLKLTAEFHGGWNAPIIVGVIGIKF